MLSNIVVLLGLLVDPVALEPGIGHVLLVDAPAHALGLQQVYDGLGRGANAVKVVVRDAERVGTGGSNVVGLGLESEDDSSAVTLQMGHTCLRGVGDGIVVGQANPLACQVFEVR